jgi:predicted N-acetyltransferase YhbS
VTAIREAHTDADLEAWREVRRAVVEGDRTPTVAELRATERPGRLLLVAERDGELAGSGLADRSSLRGRFSVAPRVVPAARRRGVGTELLRALVEHAAALGADTLVALADDPGSIAFAGRFGFAATDLQVEQVKALGVEPEPAFPSGVEIVTVAERPELLERAYGLAVEAYADMATAAPAEVTRDEWLREEATLPAGSFVALAGGEVVGYSGLLLDPDDPARAEDGLTAVRRDWRRRGLALALKLAELRWAAANGIREVFTWTQNGNDAMRALNERLGYAYGLTSTTVEAPTARVRERLAGGG